MEQKSLLPNPSPLDGLAVPSLSILIPTRDTGDLPYVFHSIKTQKLEPSDEVIIISDGEHEPVAALVEALGPPFKFARGPSTGDWGHTQLNYGLQLAQNDFILTTDDDDGYLPRALETVRHELSLAGAVPHLFSFITNTGGISWARPNGLGKIAELLVGSHNLIAPNVKDKLGLFKPRYMGDFDYIESTLDCYPKRSWIWHREILTRQRPTKRLLDWPIVTADLHYALLRIQEQTADTVPIIPTEFTWAYLFTQRGLDGYIGWNAGLLNPDGTTTIFFALAPPYRKQGLGRHILTHTLDATMGDAQTTVFSSDTDLQILLKSQLLEETSRDATTITFRYRYP